MAASQLSEKVRSEGAGLVGIFGRKKTSPTTASIISSDVLRTLPEVGRTVFSSPPSYIDVSDFYLPGFLAAGSPTDDPGWSTFVDTFLRELTYASRATAGAFHVAKDFVKSEDWAMQSLVNLMDRALMFLVQVDTDPGSIPNFALSRWTELKQQG